MPRLKPVKMLVNLLFIVLIVLNFTTEAEEENIHKNNPSQNIIDPQNRIHQIILWHSFSGPLNEKFIVFVNRFNEQLNAQNEQTKFKTSQYKIIPQYKGTYEQTLAAGVKVFNTDAAPHILQVYEMGNLLMQSNPKAYVSLDKLSEKPSSILRPEHFISFIYNFYKTRNGNHLASLPFSASSVILFYNKDAFKKAGLDPEKPPVTWEEFEKIALILKEKGAKNILASGWLSGHHLDHTGAWHNEPLATKGNGIEGENSELIVNRPFFRHHLGKLADWYQIGIFSLEFGPRSEEAFANEEILMLTQGSNRFACIEKNVNGKFQIGVGKLPYWKSHVKTPHNTIAGGASFWALAGHSKEEYAIIQKFFEYLASPSIQSEWHQETGYMPVVVGATELAKKQGFYENSVKGKAAKVALDSFSQNAPKDHSRGVLLPNFSKVRELMVHEMKEAIRGNKTPKAALEEIEKTGNQIMREKAI